MSISAFMSTEKCVMSIYKAVNIDLWGNRAEEVSKENYREKKKMSLNANSMYNTIPSCKLCVCVFVSVSV